MQKKFLATAAVATTLGGALAGAALLTPGQAGAQDDPQAPTTTEATRDATTTEAPDGTDRPAPGEHLSEALQPLVDDGTLTEAQLDAVVETLIEARGEFEGHGGPGHHGRFGGGADLAAILGIEEDALREAIMDGQTLADIAAEQGVDTQDLVDAIVTATEERVNSAVEAGRIDQERADAIVAGATDRAEDVINGDLDFRGGGRGNGFPGGPGEGALPADADA